MADPIMALDEPFGGRYKIERKLGHGGMATVYLARDLKFDGRQVALKLLRPEIASLLGRDRFLREIDLVARLNHPNILQLHDSDEAPPGDDSGQGHLYYVMPFVEGGSLQDRLAAAPRMPVDQALDLVRQVADALEYAHGCGIVHRDIKPGNILLAGNHAYVADFGIARAIRQAIATDQITESGLVVGTPAYMAPEQLQGSSQVDGRADEYALAAVLYEMLLGKTPEAELIWSASGQASLRLERPDIPPFLDSVIRKALAGRPSERFATVSEFASAIRGERSARRLTGTRRDVRRIAAIMTLIIVAVSAIAGGARWFGGSRVTGSLDTTRYALLPFETGPGVEADIGQDLELRTALRRWQGIEPVDPVRLREEVARKGGRRLTGGDAVAISRAMAAGRYLRGSITRAGDSLRITGTLYAVVGKGDSLLAEHSVNLPVSPAPGDPAWSDLVDHLLLREAKSGLGFGGLGTRSLPAWQAFDAGRAALRDWRLGAADSAFELAGRYDPDFVRAALWLGLTRQWNGDESARWQHAAERAESGRETLEGNEAAMADALVYAARGDIDRSCRAWRDLAQRISSEFAPWFGWAHCQASDSLVLRDPRSPSGWRFRSSYRSALLAYQRAFLLQTSVLSSFRAASYQRIRTLLKTSATNVRSGFGASPDAGEYVAYPGWYHDTLGFVPYPVRAFTTLPLGTEVTRAAQEQRRLFRQIALAWVASAPGNPDALEALGIALEMLGDPAAIDTLHRARLLAQQPAERVRISGTEALAILRFSMPGEPDRLRYGRALIDSLLQSAASGVEVDPTTVATMSALTGRAARAADAARKSAARESWSIPRPIRVAVLALVTYSAFGGPVDTLANLTRETVGLVSTDLAGPDQAEMLNSWLPLAAFLAFPAGDTLQLARLGGRGHLLLDAQLAFARGQRDSARAILGRLRYNRAGIPPAILTFDALYPEARLLLALGDTLEAASWMQPTLAALRFTSPESLADPWHAASLVRAMAFQADLELMTGNPTEAKRWARSAEILWSDADAFLQPAVRRLHLLSTK